MDLAFMNWVYIRVFLAPKIPLTSGLSGTATSTLLSTRAFSRARVTRATLLLSTHCAVFYTISQDENKLKIEIARGAQLA